jgi:hypothetical protein
MALWKVSVSTVPSPLSLPILCVLQASSLPQVVQSLPAHLALLTQLRQLETSEDNSLFFRKLIDVNCPYRMLYTLQVPSSPSCTSS